MGREKDVQLQELWLRAQGRCVGVKEVASESCRGTCDEAELAAFMRIQVTVVGQLVLVSSGASFTATKRHVAVLCTVQYLLGSNPQSFDERPERI